MYTLSIASTAVALLAAANIASGTPLQKRYSTCKIQASWYQQNVVGSGGPGQSPVSDTHNGIDCAVDDGEWKGIDGANGIKAGDQIIDSEDSGFTNPIQFTIHFETGSYQSCSVNNNGEITQGKKEGHGSGDGTTTASCTVEFEC